MKVTKSPSPQWERTVLLGMVLDPAFLARVAPRWRHDALASKHANMLGQLCVDYFHAYDKPPRGTIVQLAAEKLEDSGDADAAAQVDRLLQSLDDLDLPATEHLLDLAGKHLNRVSLSRLAESVQDALSCGDTSRAESLVASHRRVELGRGAGVDLFLDEAAVRNAFPQGDDNEDLFRYPGDLGHFFAGKDILSREAMLCFLAPIKSGKCVSEDTEVLLTDGRVEKIRCIVERNDTTPVVSLDEESQRLVPATVSQFWDNGEKECWEVTTRTGRKVATTANHQFLTPDGWKFLEDIGPGECIAVPKRMAVFGTHPMTESDVKFVAYMLADGCCVVNGTDAKTQACSFTKADKTIASDFVAVCADLGFSCRNRGIHYYPRDGARDHLRKYGLAGHSSKTKTVPIEVFQCSKKKIAMFLSVFFSCDGHVTRKGNLELTLANERLLGQINHLLLRFGIVGRTFYKKSRCNGKVFDSWRLVISDRKSVGIFFQEINMISYKGRNYHCIDSGRSFLDKFPPQVADRFLKELGKECGGARGLNQILGDKRAGWVRAAIARKGFSMRGSFLPAVGTAAFAKYMDSDVLWDEVVSVRSIGVRKTYDLGVNSHHNFVANDCIVHNSFLLMDVAWRAMLNRRRVAFFQVGDLSERQMYSRFLVKATKRPLRGVSWPLTVRIPISIAAPPKNEFCASVGFRDKVFNSPLNPDEAWEACQRVMQNKVRSKQSYFRCSVHPNFSISARGVRDILLEWQRDGFVADVVVIDYADLLSPSPGTQKYDKRDQVDTTWKQLRAVSTELHCLLVTATQANRESFNTVLMKRSCVGEDVRKLAHASGICAINVTAQDKERQLSRLQWIALREGEFFMERVVHVANCLALADPCVLSTY